MKRKTGLTVLLLLLVGSVAGLGAYVFVLQSASSGAAAEATSYLAANYNTRVGLIPEVPGGNTYYVYSDNLLAAYVLDSSSSPSDRAIAANITLTMTRMLAKTPHASNQYQVVTSGNASFFASNDYVLGHVGSAVIKVTLNNGSSPLSPAKYADTAFLEAIYFEKVNRGYAVSEFNLGVKLYDGHGFSDQSFTGGQYQTYKLALYDYVGKILGESVPSSVESDILKMQAPSGGFYTGYDSNLSSDGTSTNTETTCLAILALTAPRAATPAAAVSAYLPLLVGTTVVAWNAGAAGVNTNSWRVNGASSPGP